MMSPPIRLCAILSFFGFASAFRGIPERVYLDYYNPKYVNYANTSITRSNRKSPYMINFDIDLKYDFGNNGSIKVDVFEEINARSIQLPISINKGLCDFLLKDEVFGQAWSKAARVKECPVKAGVNKFRDINVNYEYIPYRIPFTYSSITVKVRADICFYLTGTDVIAVLWKIHYRIVQKPNEPLKSG